MQINSDQVRTIRDFQVLSELQLMFENLDLDNEYFTSADRRDVEQKIENAITKCRNKIESFE